MFFESGIRHCPVTGFFFVAVKPFSFWPIYYQDV
ncbi:hypothetical protein SAMN04488128_103534 [Chitinophaga eiseniae]|uniref:Uncharacterized protein n=1 Tax=Chitinophaga eiseniae TaxID=634771 RepID=A0A1T4SV37_9BACT|nr:hypothetical protein SAMN04488128_103534 [Chitinophaga eiseniae]